MFVHECGRRKLPGHYSRIQDSVSHGPLSHKHTRRILRPIDYHDYIWHQSRIHTVTTLPEPFDYLDEMDVSSLSVYDAVIANKKKRF